MKSGEQDHGGFSTLEGLYDYLESYQAPLNDYKVVESIGELVAALDEAGENEQARKAQHELLAFAFNLSDAGAGPRFSGKTPDGDDYCWPDLESLDEEAIDYYKARVAETNNPQIRARYAQILWEAPAKHATYAKTAVEGYFDSITTYLEARRTKDDGKRDLALAVELEVMCKMAAAVKHRESECRDLLLQVLQSREPDTPGWRATCLRLSSYSLKSRLFAAEDYETVQAAVTSLGDQFKAEGKTSQAINAAALAIKLEQKTQTRTRDWNREMAELYEREFLRLVDSDPVLAFTDCQAAADYYGKAGDKQKSSELEARLSQLRPKIGGQTLETSLDVGPLLDQVRLMVDALIEHEIEEILTELAAGPSIVPDYETTRLSVEETSRETPFLNMLPIAVHDERGNLAEHCDDATEKERFNVMRIYILDSLAGRGPFIGETIKALITKRGATAEDLEAFLRERTWLGGEIAMDGPSGAARHYCWLDLLMPGLRAYWAELGDVLAGAKELPNVVLVIDSLATKIEGILRDILALKGGTTMYQMTDRKGRRITREKDLDQLLREPIVLAAIGENNAWYIRFLLTEKGGLNLRHKVAHSLMLPDEYTWHLVNFLILAILRLGSTDLTLCEDAAQNS